MVGTGAVAWGDIEEAGKGSEGGSLFIPPPTTRTLQCPKVLAQPASRAPALSAGSLL